MCAVRAGSSNMQLQRSQQDSEKEAGIGSSCMKQPGSTQEPLCALCHGDARVNEDDGWATDMAGMLGRPFREQEAREERQRMRRDYGVTYEDDGFGSFDDGDPFTTNLYVGNLAPTVDEEVCTLCRVHHSIGICLSCRDSLHHPIP